MRVFVAGATGVLGRRAVPALAAAGHEVTALVRSPAKAALARSLGATPVEVSLFDPDALRAAVAGHDAVCNLATHIPPLAKAAQPGSWQENSRIRTEGSRNLVDAALAAGAACYVQESIAFLYGEHGDEWIDASTTPIVESAPTGPVARRGGRGGPLRGGGRARRGAAVRRLRRPRQRPDAHDPAGGPPRASRSSPAGPKGGSRRSRPTTPRPRWSPRSPRRAGPTTSSTTNRSAAATRARRWPPPSGRRRLYVMPSAKRVVGPLADSQRVSNRRFRDATGWAPRVPSLREGWPATARAAGIEPALPGKVRLLLWLLALGNLGVGIQAAFTPRSFYDDFPLGRGWVAMDGPYNQHLVRDVGSLNLALGGARVRGAGGRDAHDGPHRDDRVAGQRRAALRVPLASPDDEHGGRRQGRDRRDARFRGRSADRGVGVDPQAGRRRRDVR